MSLTDAELTKLYDQYAHVIYHRCLSILGNEELARDALQETFVKVLRHSEDFRGQSSPLTWMYRISTNHCLNQIRNRKGRQEKLHVRREEIIGEGMTRPDEEGGDRAMIMTLLEGADEETRKCVVHTYFDDCTRSEVAELVGLSVPTVRKRINGFLHAARQAMGVGLDDVVLLLISLGPALNNALLHAGDA